MSRVEKAVWLFKEGGLNCAQSILSVYGVDLGMMEETAVKAASAFGGGMGRMAETCGAVTGAFLVLGLKYEIGDVKAKEKVYGQVREFAAEFKERNKTICCRELLGYDVSTPDGDQIVKEKKLTTILCPQFVQDAAEILEEMLKDGKG